MIAMTTPVLAYYDMRMLDPIEGVRWMLPTAASTAQLERVHDKPHKAFQPDILLVSSGFDCHYLDMTCAMDETGFAILAQRMCDLADELCDGRLVLLLEGGYNAQALADSAHAVVKVLAGNPVNACNVLPNDPGCKAVAHAVQFHKELKTQRNLARTGCY